MKLLNRAKKVAARSPSHFKHAALVFQGGALLAESTNGCAGEDHAEVAALKDAHNRTTRKRGFTLLSVRVSSTGTLRIARPCEECMQFMQKMGVHTCLFSTAEGTIERIRL